MVFPSLFSLEPGCDTFLFLKMLTVCTPCTIKSVPCITSSPNDLNILEAVGNIRKRHKTLPLCLTELCCIQRVAVSFYLWIRNSHLRQSEKDSTANLEMQYPPPFAATLPRTDATLTMRPRAFLMSGRKVVVMPITPFMLTFNVL